MELRKLCLTAWNHPLVKIPGCKEVIGGPIIGSHNNTWDWDDGMLVAERIGHLAGSWVELTVGWIVQSCDKFGAGLSGWLACWFRAGLSLALRKLGLRAQKISLVGLRAHQMH